MSEWISVKDRMPEDNGAYLVVVCGGRIVDRYVKTWFFWNGKFEDLQYYSTKYISHWMPLPELPEVKE